MVMVIITILGIYYTFTIPKEAMPQIVMGKFVITVAYPGVAPDEIETLIIDKIEDELSDITDIDYMSVDTEGSELAALKTFPFHRLMPRIIGVEVLIGDGRGSIVQDKLIEFMQEKKNLL
jgi:hypothetical protein